jgi:AcrR family transcriptional regulator
MDQFLSKLEIKVNEKLYLKHPDSSELGKKIIGGGVELIDEIGFDAFTFRKLASHIESTEASVYRYFESKHKLLLYLTSWYWGWMEYRLMFATANVNSAKERLERSISLITEQVVDNNAYVGINLIKLNQIVINESSKAYLIKEVDIENKEGAYTDYKQFVARIRDIILEINPKYKYPHMLISTVIEGAHHQHYFAEHLPRLTDVIVGEDAISAFYTDMVLKSIMDSRKVK